MALIYISWMLSQSITYVLECKNSLKSIQSCLAFRSFIWVQCSFRVDKAPGIHRCGYRWVSLSDLLCHATLHPILAQKCKLKLLPSDIYQYLMWKRHYSFLNLSHSTCTFPPHVLPLPMCQQQSYLRLCEGRSSWKASRGTVTAAFGFWGISWLTLDMP